MVWRLPLSLVLGLQVLIVAAAFAAVVSVLSIQQGNEFRDSLHERLAIRQKYAMETITAPVLKRIDKFSIAVTSYMNGKDNNKQYACPSDDPATSTLSNALPFYNHFYILAKEDPAFSLITLGNQSMRVWAPYAGTPRPYIWNIWATDAVKLAAITEGNERAKACFASYPIPSIAAKCPNPLGLDYPTNYAYNHPIEFRRTRRILGAASINKDPTSPAGQTMVVSFGITAPWTPNFVIDTVAEPTRPYAERVVVFGASISVEHIKPLILAQSAHVNARSALFTKFIRLEYGTVDHQFIAGKVDFPDYDEDIYAEHKALDLAAWKGGRTPDPVLNAVFDRAEFMFENITDAAAFELTVGGSKYVASAGRTFDAYNDMNWLVIEYTPRDDFYGASDLSRMAGIIIGVVGGVVVLVVCILIWLAIQIPLSSLGASMALAAEMKNDRVVYSNPILSEIGTLNDAFKRMNNRLLAARPFLPQSLLRASGTDDDDIDGDGELGDAGRNSDDDDDELSAHTRKNNAVNGGQGRRADESSGSAALGSSNRRRRGGDESTTYSKSSAMTSTNKRHHTSTIVLISSSREMVFKRVAVLSINVVGFSDAAHHHDGNGSGAATSSPQHTTRLHAALAKLVEQTTAEERGIVDYFHGDRFVCGFNTARVCGNAARNGAEAAAKIWDRFLSHTSPTSGRNELLAAFPNGLAMGLGVGRAAVGNHGTETMQRLATIGGAYSEAMRLQEVMTRRVLLKCSGSSDDGADRNNKVSNTATTADSPDGPNPLVAGRCLVMGRVVQDLETSKVYCQIVGAVDARELLTAKAASNRAVVAAFAAGKNLRVGRSRTGEAGPASSGTQLASNINTCSSSSRSARTVLVAAVVSHAAVRDAMAPKGAGNAKVVDTSCRLSPRDVGDESSAAEAVGTPRRAHVTTTVTTPLRTPTTKALMMTMGNGNSSPHHPHNHNQLLIKKENDEWLYELEHLHAENPFTLINKALYRLWVEGLATVAARSDLVPPSIEAFLSQQNENPLSFGSAQSLPPPHSAATPRTRALLEASDDDPLRSSGGVGHNNNNDKLAAPLAAVGGVGESSFSYSVPSSRLTLARLAAWGQHVFAAFTQGGGPDAESIKERFLY